MITLHGNQYTISIISRSFLLRMKNIWNKSCRENPNTHFVFNNFFENHSLYEIIWKKLYNQTDHGRQYGACALHAEYLRLQKHTQNV
jgi:hypothetical protein